MRRLSPLSPVAAALALLLVGAGPARAQRCPFQAQYSVAMQQRSYIQYQQMQDAAQRQSYQTAMHTATTQRPMVVPNRTAYTQYANNHVPPVVHQANFPSRSSYVVAHHTWHESYSVRTASHTALTHHIVGTHCTHPGHHAPSVSHHTVHETWHERHLSLHTRYEHRQVENNHLTTHLTPGRMVSTTRHTAGERPHTVPITHTARRPEDTRRNVETTTDRLKARRVTQTDLTVNVSFTCGRCHQHQPQPQRTVTPGGPGGPLLVRQPGAPGRLPVLGDGMRPLIPGMIPRGPGPAIQRPNLPAWPDLVPGPELPPLARLPGMKPNAPGRIGTPERPSPSRTPGGQRSPGQVPSPGPSEAAWLPSAPPGSPGRVPAAPAPGELGLVALATPDFPPTPAQALIPPPPLPPLPRAAWEPPARPALMGDPSEPPAFLALPPTGESAPARALEPPPLPPLPRAAQPWATGEPVALK